MAPVSSWAGAGPGRGAVRRPPDRSWSRPGAGAGADRAAAETLHGGLAAARRAGAGGVCSPVSGDWRAQLCRWVR